MQLSLGRVIFIFLLVIVIIGGIASFLVLNHTSKPFTKAQEQAALVKMLGRKPNLQDAPSGSVLYNGKYASFSYPAMAKIYNDKNSASVKTNLETFSFDIENPRLICNFSVMENNAKLSDVTEISGVMLRQDKSRGYVQSSIDVEGNSGLAFALGGDSPEKTGFWLFNNRIYTLSVTGSDYTSVVNLFDNITKSMEFK